jgi:hypothetical protein
VTFPDREIDLLPQKEFDVIEVGPLPAGPTPIVVAEPRGK